MDIEKLEREIAMRMAGERPQGWPTDERGNFFWESQILTDLLREYESVPEAQAYFQTKFDELKARGQDRPIAPPTAKPATIATMRGNDG